MRGSLLLLALTGCATGRYSGPSTLSPVQHRAVRALIGATVTLGAKEVGIKPTAALLIGTVGQVAAAKGLMAFTHPDWFGWSWTPGDIACDVVSSAAILPLWAGRHLRKRDGFDWPAALVAGLAWGGAMALSDDWCLP